MLELFADKVNMGQISKLLVKYKIRATVNDSTITIYGTIPEDLACELYSNVHIIAFNNYDNCQESVDATPVSENAKKAEKLALKRKTETVTVSKPEIKTVVQTKTVYVEKDLDRDLNLAQMQLLSFVDIDELISISRSSTEDIEKAHKILRLFGFDFGKNGVQYLLDAICIAPKSEYFNLETLSQKLSETGEYTIEASEIQRLIVARVKERFRFKKSPTIDFIRLVNRLLTKKEEK